MITDDAARIGTAIVLAAAVRNGTMKGATYPAFAKEVFEMLRGLGTAEQLPPEPVKPVPAVDPASSVTPAALISLIDGRSYKSLKRHLAANGYTPVSYRQAFDLPADYPMVCEDYAATRSIIARGMNLGRHNQ